MREAAHGLARRGWDVEVLTTCARDHYTWHNEYAPGTTTHDDGVVVHRFPVEGSKPSRSRARIEARIQSGAPVSLADQLAWLDGLFRVPRLFHHLVVNSDRYDAVILSPYLFWTTVTGATIVPERTIVMPCLHDEPYARLEVLNPVLVRRRPPVVPLRARARARARVRVAPRRTSSPAPASTCPTSYDPDGFCARHGLDAAVRAVRRPARAGQGLGLAARGVPLRDPPVRAAVRPRDDRREPGRHAGRPLRPRPRPRLPRRRRSRRRVRGGGRLRAAEHQRELLAHDHGVVAGRHTGARGRPAATCCAGTAIAPAAA